MISVREGSREMIFHAGRTGRASFHRLGVALEIQSVRPDEVAVVNRAHCIDTRRPHWDPPGLAFCARGSRGGHGVRAACTIRLRIDRDTPNVNGRKKIAKRPSRNKKRD